MANVSYIRVFRIQVILEHPFDIDSHFEDNFYYVRYLNVCP